METLVIKVTEDDVGKRLDKTLATHTPDDLSRARLQSLIEKGHVTLDDAPATDCSVKVKLDQTYTVIIPPLEDATPQPEDIPLDIVYEDEHLLVINKAAGMVVHPAAGNYDGTLVNALLFHCGDTLSGIGGVKRPGIVHRLDKDTSGVMIVAKNDAAHHGLSEQLSTRTLKRTYQALVWGVPSSKTGRIETLMGRSNTQRKKMSVLKRDGKEAITDYETEETFGVIASLVTCRLKTGRTHQIRVHMAHIGHWLIGDSSYGHKSPRKLVKLHKIKDDLADILVGFPRQALHAARLEFIHPISKDVISLSAPMPEDMQTLFNTLKGIKTT